VHHYPRSSLPGSKSLSVMLWRQWFCSRHLGTQGIGGGGLSGVVPGAASARCDGCCSSIRVPFKLLVAVVLFFDPAVLVLLKARSGGGKAEAT